LEEEKKRKEKKRKEKKRPGLGALYLASKLPTYGTHSQHDKQPPRQNNKYPTVS